MVDYLILLNAIVVTCILEQVAEHSNRRAGLFRLAQNKLAEVEFAVLSLRRWVELSRKASRSSTSPASAHHAVRDEVCLLVASASLPTLDISFPFIFTSLTHPQRRIARSFPTY